MRRLDRFGQSTDIDVVFCDGCQWQSSGQPFEPFDQEPWSQQQPFVLGNHSGVVDPFDLQPRLRNHLVHLQPTHPGSPLSAEREQSDEAMA